MGKYIDTSDEESNDDYSKDEYSTDEEMGSFEEPLDRSGSKPLTPVKNNTAMEVLSGVVAAASVATSVGAMIVSPVNVVYAAGGLSWWAISCSCFLSYLEVYFVFLACLLNKLFSYILSVIGPYAFFQQKRLTDVIALQETHNALSAEIDRLASENDRLHLAVKDLSQTVDRLEDVEQTLDTITNMQGQSVQALEEQVEDNRDILSKMQSNLKANVLQNLLQVVIQSDRDDDMDIEGDEVEDLIKRIEGIHGVEVRKDRFRDVIENSNGSLQSVMDIIKNLMADESSEDSDIFIFKE